MLSKRRKLNSDVFMIQLPMTVLKPSILMSLYRKCDDIKESPTNGSIIVTVHNYSEYSFSDEYTHVYKAKFNKAHVYEDLLATVKRAVKSASIQITDSICTQFSEHVIKRTFWEVDQSSAIFAETIKSVYPLWSSHPIYESTYKESTKHTCRPLR